MNLDTADRFYGAWWGAFIGDALGMPTHGYADAHAVKADYGSIDGYRQPLEPYPYPLLEKLPLPELPAKYDYLGDRRRQLWRRRGTHPHSAMAAGENTLQMILAMHLVATIDASGFDLARWIERYEGVMTMPQLNPDTFIATIHRKYFDNLAAGRDPEKNGSADAHMADIATFIPIMFFGLRRPDMAQAFLQKTLKKFTVGESAWKTAVFLSNLLKLLFAGNTLEEALYDKMTPDAHVSLAYPYRRWIKNSGDDEVVASVGTRAPLEEAIPLALYISLKYGQDMKKALCLNAQLGGETTGRGSVIGMLVGAQLGFSKIPPAFVANLKYVEEIQALGAMLLNYVKTI